jgi:hypothetical protein
LYELPRPTRGAAYAAEEGQGWPTFRRLTSDNPELSDVDGNRQVRRFWRNKPPKSAVAIAQRGHFQGIWQQENIDIKSIYGRPGQERPTAF